MNTAWKTTTLGAEIDLLAGFAFKSKAYTDKPTDIRLLRGDNIVQGCLRWDDVKRWPATDIESYDRYQLHEGDVVLAMDRPWVKAGLKHATITADDLPCLLVQRTARLRAGANLTNRYLMYLLGSNAFTDHILGVQTGIGVPHISGQQIKDFEFDRPPLTEQQRIVGILDEAFEGIATAKANAEKNLQNARALFESHLQSVFTQRGEGWTEKRVDELATKSLGKMLDRAKNRGDLQPYLRNLNVRWFEFDLSDLAEMPFEEAESERYTTQAGDVMICEGGYPGRAAVWEEEFPIYFQKAIHRVRFHQRELSHWFVYYLYHCDSSGTLRQHFTGSGIQHFTGQSLARFTVPVPPLRAITQLVARFHSIREETQRLATIYERKLAALDELKKSLLHQAFSGEL